MDPPLLQVQLFSVPLTANIWYVSDYGSDDNDCHSASAPCRNLQTVLDRATDGADIYVTSRTLSLDESHARLEYQQTLIGNSRIGYDEKACRVSSNLSYTISSVRDAGANFTCSG